MIGVNIMMKKIQFKDVSQIYCGKQDSCRCGCGGYYVATSNMINPRSDVNDKVCKKLIKEFNRIMKYKGLAEDQETYKEVSLDNKTCITIYLDEIKKNKG